MGKWGKCKWANGEKWRCLGAKHTKDHQKGNICRRQSSVIGRRRRCCCLLSFLVLVLSVSLLSLNFILFYYQWNGGRAPLPRLFLLPLLLASCSSCFFLLQ
ncbi:hypothetical protein F5Y14DRAFT_425736 [Nemania sp. NC0429]|nr:hypothetical protein F5Y14DRAFT_425736 [Nemania sp. NC0429]